MNRAMQKARALPAFLEDRMTRFYEGRVRAEWGGKHLFHGSAPGPDSLLLYSNDYLDISRHPLLVEAQCTALKSTAAGSMKSSIFDQDIDGPLRRTERSLADALGSAEGVLTQSGYIANIGLLQAISGPGIPVYIDFKAHPSLLAGIRFAGATAVQFRHNDVSDLGAKIARKGSGVVVVDSVYSTDGSVAPLAKMCETARDGDCVIVVDESHSFGTHGTHGHGIVVGQGLTDRVHFVTVSLAKAHCSRAGFIACPAGFGDYFGLESLPAVFSSALLPHDIASIEAAHAIVVDEEWRRTRLHEVTRYVRSTLAALDYPVSAEGEQIIALEVGSDVDTAAVRDALEQKDIFGALLTPPATSRGRSLVRLSLHAGLSDLDVERLINGLRHIRDAMDLTRWSGVRRRHRGRPS